MEVHDLVLTYESDSRYRVISDLFYINMISLEDPSSIELLEQYDVGGYSDIGVGRGSFDKWLTTPSGLSRRSSSTATV